jgi:hypothetical protein
MLRGLWLQLWILSSYVASLASVTLRPKGEEWRAAYPIHVEVQGKPYSMCYTPDEHKVFIGDDACVSVDESVHFGACELRCSSLHEINCGTGKIVYTQATVEPADRSIVDAEKEELQLLATQLPANTQDEIALLQSHIPFSSEEAAQVDALLEKFGGRRRMETIDRRFDQELCQVVADYTAVNSTIPGDAEFLEEPDWSFSDRIEMCHLCDTHSCIELQEMNSYHGNTVKSAWSSDTVSGTLSACLFCEGAAAPGACNFADPQAAVRDWPVCDDLCRESECDVIEEAITSLLLEEMNVHSAKLDKYLHRFMYPMCYACSRGDGDLCETRNRPLPVDDEDILAASSPAFGSSSYIANFIHTHDVQAASARSDSTGAGSGSSYEHISEYVGSYIAAPGARQESDQDEKVVADTARASKYAAEHYPDSYPAKPALLDNGRGDGLDHDLDQDSDADGTADGTADGAADGGVGGGVDAFDDDGLEKRMEEAMDLLRGSFSEEDNEEDTKGDYKYSSFGEGRTADEQGGVDDDIQGDYKYSSFVTGVPFAHGVGSGSGSGSGSGKSALEGVHRTSSPSVAPTLPQSPSPSVPPSTSPSGAPSSSPSLVPTTLPTLGPTASPSAPPTFAPSAPPTKAPTMAPTSRPTLAPTAAPTKPRLMVKILSYMTLLGGGFESTAQFSPAHEEAFCEAVAASTGVQKEQVVVTDLEALVMDDLVMTDVAAGLRKRQLQQVSQALRQAQRTRQGQQARQGQRARQRRGLGASGRIAGGVRRAAEMGLLIGEAQGTERDGANGAEGGGGKFVTGTQEGTERILLPMEGGNGITLEYEIRGLGLDEVDEVLVRAKDVEAELEYIAYDATHFTKNLVQFWQEGNCTFSAPARSPFPPGADLSGGTEEMYLSGSLGNDEIVSTEVSPLSVSATAGKEEMYMSNDVSVLVTPTPVPVPTLAPTEPPTVDPSVDVYGPEFSPAPDSSADSSVALSAPATAAADTLAAATAAGDTASAVLAPASSPGEGSEAPYHLRSEAYLVWGTHNGMAADSSTGAEVAEAAGAEEGGGGAEAAAEAASQTEGAVPANDERVSEGEKTAAAAENETGAADKTIAKGQVQTVPVGETGEEWALPEAFGSRCEQCQRMTCHDVESDLSTDIPAYEASNPFIVPASSPENFGNGISLVLDACLFCGLGDHSTAESTEEVAVAEDVHTCTFRQQFGWVTEEWPVCHPRCQHTECAEIGKEVEPHLIKVRAWTRYAWRVRVFQSRALHACVRTCVG